MDMKSMAKGIGLGMMAGAAVSMMAAPKKKSHKTNSVSKAIRAMGEVLEDVETALGW